MQQALTLTQTTVGKKALVAVTGLIMFGFTIGHLAGNLLIFADSDGAALRAYSEFLHHNWEITWPVRTVLLVSVVVHLALTLELWQRNRAARPSGYRHGRRDQLTTYAARTMVISGPILLAFIVFHLAHLTFGVTFGLYEHQWLDPMPNLVASFSIWWIAAFYIFSNIILGLHLVHGVWSALQSIGASHPRYHVLRQRIATGLVFAIAAGNVLIPLLVLAGVVPFGR